MSVNLIVSGTSGGTDLPEEISLGSHSPGDDTSTSDIFISHDGDNEITDVALYIMRDISSTYPGDDPDTDILTLLGWADDDSSDGVQINMNATSPSWLPMDSTDGNESNPRTLDEDSIVVGTPAGDGVIPVGGEAQVQCKVVIPSTVSSSGIMGFSLVIAYSATS